MTNNQHLIQANRLYMLIADLRNHEHYRQLRPVIGELIWGVLVHALSAADPSHENQPPDRFGNPHQAPAGADAFRQAIRRAPNLGLSEARMESCLAWGQRKLHNHYYNGNPSDDELDTAIMVSAVYAMRLHYCAVEQTMPSAKVGTSGFTGRWLAYIDLPRRYHLANPNGFVTSQQRGQLAIPALPTTPY